MIVLTGLLGFFLSDNAVAQTTESLSIMTFNVRVSSLYGWDVASSSWYNTEAVSGNDAVTGSDWQTMKRGGAVAQSILDSSADIVGLQEYLPDSQGGAGYQDLVNRLAARGGGQWYYSNAGGGILSKYQTVEVSAGNRGARFEFPGRHEARVFNQHYGLDPNWNDSYIPNAARDGHSE